MDERRIEQVLRQGPPFATAYVARPLPLDEAVAERRGLTARRVALALLTTPCSWRPLWRPWPPSDSSAVRTPGPL